MLRADPGKRAEIDRAIAKNGRWVWKFDNPVLGYVEYIEFDSMYEVDQEMKDDLPVEDPDELAAVEAAVADVAAKLDLVIAALLQQGAKAKVRRRAHTPLGAPFRRGARDACSPCYARPGTL